MKKLSILAAAAAIVLTAGAANAQSNWNVGYGARVAPVPARSTGGTILTDELGRTLYVFDNDRPLTSNCTGPCAVNWPPARAGSNSTPGGDWQILSRSDGTLQWMHRGRPLYRWINDTAPAQRNGAGFGGVWHVSTLEGRLAELPPAPVRRAAVVRPAAARPATPTARPAARPATSPATQARPAPAPTNPRPATR